MTLEDENVLLKAENAALREQVMILATRMQELEARLAKDSHNSSKPPSSDGLTRKTTSLRRRSGKKSGGQIGHRGETLRLVATPHVVVRKRRHVHELPPIRLHITEHQALHLRCPACQAVTAGRFPAEVPSRVQYGPRLRALAVYLVEQLVPYSRVRELLADLVAAELSLGTLVEWVRRAALTLEPMEAALETVFAGQPIYPHLSGMAPPHW